MKRWLDMNLISDSQPELGMEISLEKGEEISFKKEKDWYEEFLHLDFIQHVFAEWVRVSHALQGPRL